MNIDKMFEYCVGQIDNGLPKFEKAFPTAVTKGKLYAAETYNCEWTEGFWTGMLWLAYEVTKEEKYKEIALGQVDLMYDRIVNRVGVDHHDMGFLYLPSCVKAYRMCGSETGKKAALLAADNLCTRFQEKGQFIQAWGELGAADNYRLIIDCLLNIPLLFWAEKETGNTRYGEIAKAHLYTTLDVVIREDGSTFHTYFFDPETGKPHHGQTAQGYSDSSIWSRGQAWGVYGTALGYYHTHDEKLIEKFYKVTDLFLKNLPKDNIPAWDMIFTDTKTQKDTSAAAIAASGILLMSRICDIDAHYCEKAKQMMEALCEHGKVEGVAESSGVLDHGVYAFKTNTGVDECSLWGDYFFMEALMRLKDIEWVSCFE